MTGHPASKHAERQQSGLKLLQLKLALTRYPCRENLTSMLRQFNKQSLSLVQVRRVKALGEPAVDRSEKFSGVILLPLIAPQPRHPHGRAQLPGFNPLLTCDCERPLEIRFRPCCISRLPELVQLGGRRLGPGQGR